MSPLPRNYHFIQHAQLVFVYNNESTTNRSLRFGRPHTCALSISVVPLSQYKIERLSFAWRRVVGIHHVQIPIPWVFGSGTELRGRTTYLKHLQARRTVAEKMMIRVREATSADHLDRIVGYVMMWCMLIPMET